MPHGPERRPDVSCGCSRSPEERRAGGPCSEVGDATAYGSQTAFVLPVQGALGTSYLYMGDRWGNSMGGTVNDSQYVWLPLAFPTPTITGIGGGPYYNLVARHSGKCLDVADSSTGDGARLSQCPCGTGANQQFQRPAV